jgi:hypothetical protein
VLAQLLQRESTQWQRNANENVRGWSPDVF